MYRSDASTTSTPTLPTPAASPSAGPGDPGTGGGRHGHPGSPVVDDATGNTGGGRCTMNNPCEADENGAVTVRRNINYVQQTYPLTACFGLDGRLDPHAGGCTPPKP
ncbi:hypothetical protein [Streptomyces sp. TE5632]